MTILEPFLPLSDLEVEMEGDRVAFVGFDMTEVDDVMIPRGYACYFDDQVVGLVKKGTKNLCQRSCVGAAGCVDQMMIVRGINLFG